MERKAKKQVTVRVTTEVDCSIDLKREFEFADDREFALKYGIGTVTIERECDHCGGWEHVDSLGHVVLEPTEIAYHIDEMLAANGLEDAFVIE